MRVLIHAHGQDTGGQGHRIREAFATHRPDIEVDAVNAAPSLLHYPEQFAMGRRGRFELAHKLYDAADVVHLRNTLQSWMRWDGKQGKPIVLHHHGSIFRNGHVVLSNHAHRIGAVQVASTIDLTLLEPDVAWLPSPYPVDEMHAQRRQHDGPLRIGYFPTSPRIKSLPAFMAAWQRLRAERRGSVELVTNISAKRIARMAWADVLAAKASCDIYFDQVRLGIGNNALEAMAYGIPVIAGTDDPRLRAAMVERFGMLPWVESDEAGIYDALRALVDSPAMRTEYGAMGLAHVRRFHDYPVVVEQLADIYESAQPTIPQALTPYGGRNFVKPTRFERREQVMAVRRAAKVRAA